MCSLLGSVYADKSLCAGNDAEGVWLLRPQNVNISADKNGIGVVIEQQFMGDCCRYTVQVADHRLVVNSGFVFDVGTQVKVDIQPHDPVVFSVAS